MYFTLIYISQLISSFSRIHRDNRESDGGRVMNILKMKTGPIEDEFLHTFENSSEVCRNELNVLIIIPYCSLDRNLMVKLQKVCNKTR